jgi:fructose transport system substrate-binding protein
MIGRSARRGLVRGAVLGATLAIALSGLTVAQDEKILVGLVVKDLDNPFFVKMIDGAQAEAAKLGNITVQYLSGRDSADNEGQVTGIETLISAGAKGILLTASDSKGIVPTVQEAIENGLLVIALDTQLDPPDAAQATFATDNRLAGELIGKWAAGHLGADAVANAKIAAINDSTLQTSVDVQRNQGFMDGFGVDVKDPAIWGDEDDPRIVGQDVSNGTQALGRTAMENLLAAHQDITVLHTINEPTANGAYLAIEALGLQDQITIVSVDGSCSGVQDVKDGKVGATAMQFPLKMAELGVDAIAQYAKDGTLPQPSEGKAFYDTGVALITDQPVDGLESYDTTWGLANCWGDKPAAATAAP